MVVLPAPTAVSRPLALTDATCTLSEVHVKVAAVTADPSLVRATAANCSVAPTMSDAFGAVTSTRAVTMGGVESLPHAVIAPTQNAAATRDRQRANITPPNVFSSTRCLRAGRCRSGSG